MGCNLGQGFLLGRPLAPEQAAELLGGASWREAPSRAPERIPVEVGANTMLH